MVYKSIIWTLIILSLVYSVSALDCDYTINETYSEPEEVLCYENTNIIAGKALKISEFIQGNQQIAFMVHNPNQYEVSALFTYNITGNITGENEKWVIIKPFNDSYVQQYCFDDKTPVDCAIEQSSISYIIARPQRMYPRIMDVTKVRQICEICPSGIPCLKDGKSCKSDGDCKSRECNTDRVCGPFNGICHNALKKCDNSCLIPATKGTDIPYLCEWECDENTIPCDGICREIASKTIGQKYYCIQECKSQRGYNGMCAPSIAQWIIFAIISTIMTAAGIWYFAIYKTGEEKEKAKAAEKNRREEEKKIKNLKEQANEFEKQKENVIKLIEDINEDIAQLQISKKNELNKIKQLEEKSKNSEKYAEDRIKEDMDFARKNTIHIEKKLETKKDQLKTQENNLKEWEIYLKEKRQDLARHAKKLIENDSELKEKEYDQSIKKQLNRYTHQFNGSGKEVIYDIEKRYFMMKYRSGNEEPLQRYIYRNHFELNKYEEIHHIDCDPLNNEIWNLIALPREKHNSKYPDHFQHKKVWKKDWLLGYNELKKYLDWKDSDFHEFIRKHLNEIKNKNYNQELLK